MARNKLAEGRCTREKPNTEMPAPRVPPEERAAELLARVTREKMMKDPKKLAAIRTGFTKYCSNRFTENPGFPTITERTARNRMKKNGHL